MRRFIVLVALLVVLVAGVAVASITRAFAADPGTQGQPNQSCQQVFTSGTFTPQGFNTAGFNHATTVYAGSQPQNSNNPNSVSQYDVACFQNGQH
jgi:hypothetical protein